MIDIQALNLPKINSVDQDERISAILMPDQHFEIEAGEYVELPEASIAMITNYHNFLLNRLSPGVKITGREDLGYFAWEERFLWTNNNSKEYEALKKQFASFGDKFTFCKLSSLSEDFGVMAEVKRIKDQRVFIIPLADLEICKQTAKEYQLVEDYSSWFVNFGPDA